MTTNAVSEVRTLAGGLLVEVDAKGKATPLGCSWLIEVASGNPEPDSYADTVRHVDCGARMIDDGYGSFHCEDGHRHVSYADPNYPSFEAEMVYQEGASNGA